MVLAIESKGNGQKAPKLPTLQRRTFSVDQVQVDWMIPGDPQYAFLPAGTSDEIELTLVPRDEWSVAHDECTRPAAAALVRGVSDSERQSHS